VIDKLTHAQRRWQTTLRSITHTTFPISLSIIDENDCVWHSTASVTSSRSTHTR